MERIMSFKDYVIKFYDWVKEQSVAHQKAILVAITAIVVGLVAYTSGYIDGLF